MRSRSIGISPPTTKSYGRGREEVGTERYLGRQTSRHYVWVDVPVEGKIWEGVHEYWELKGRGSPGFGRRSRTHTEVGGLRLVECPHAWGSGLPTSTRRSPTPTLISTYSSDRVGVCKNVPRRSTCHLGPVLLFLIQHLIPPEQDPGVYNPHSDLTLFSILLYSW